MGRALAEFHASRRSAALAALASLAAACGARSSLPIPSISGGGAPTTSGSGGSGTSSSVGTGGFTSEPVVLLAEGTEPTVAANAFGAVAVAWTDHTTSAIGYVISTDDGASFPPAGFVVSPPIIGDESRWAIEPVLAVDLAGNFWMVWLGFSLFVEAGRFDTKVYVAKAPAGTTAFGAPVEISDPFDDGLTAFHQKPWIAVTNTGVIVVVYEREGASLDVTPGFDLIASRSENGLDWHRSTIVHSSDAGTSLRLPFPCAPKTGDRVWVTYVARSAVGGSVRLLSSDDGGASWATQGPQVNADGEDVAFEDPNCVAEGNEVWVSYGLTAHPEPPGTFDPSFGVRLAHSGDGGDTIDGRIDVTDNDPATFFMHPQIAREDSGAIHVQYYAGTLEDAHGAFRHARAKTPTVGFSPSKVVDPRVTFLQTNDEASLGKYTGAFWRSGVLYSSYVINGEGLSEIAFVKGAAP